jgi:DNA-binding XRE family transcriptional regulator
VASIRSRYREIQKYDWLMEEPTGKVIREISAERYQSWLEDEMRVRCWKPADLARRSGLAKQTLGVILKGEASQPSAWQVACLARAFRKEPNDVYRSIGLWEPEEKPDVPLEIRHAYNELDELGRRYLVRIGLVLAEEREAYESQDAATGDVELAEPQSIAAYDNEAWAAEEKRRHEDPGDAP